MASSKYATAPVYVVGIAATPVGRHRERSFADLVKEAYLGALADARIADAGLIEATWFANLLMDFWGQRGMRGQAVLGPLMDEGLVANGQRITNVEGACASGTIAFNGAWMAIQQGAQLALAVGVEKMNDALRPPEDILGWMEGTGNLLDPDWFWRPFKDRARDLGIDFQLSPSRSMAMDAYAVLTRWHMQEYGTTIEQVAHAAAKNHTAAVKNPRAQYKFPMTVDDVLNDRGVSDPLTRAMCAPRGDAAAAVLVCSEQFLAKQPADVQARALLVRGHAIAGGFVGASWGDDRAPVVAARNAYRMAGLGPDNIDVVELHDATSFAEVHLIEDLGICPRGEGGPFTASGATQPDGVVPVNPSGGLVARGHPIGATGIMMLNELAFQLRGEAQDLQIAEPEIGLAENGGGFVATDNALSAVTILERCS